MRKLENNKIYVTLINAISNQNLIVVEEIFLYTLFSYTK